jgi:hypothetical protein
VVANVGLEVGLWGPRPPGPRPLSSPTSGKLVPK